MIFKTYFVITTFTAPSKQPYRMRFSVLQLIPLLQAITQIARDSFITSLTLIFSYPTISQSTRLVLLLHEQHKAFWEIVKRTLQAIVPAEAFVATEQKIDRSFASGYGTVLYYEDTTVVRKLQEQFPTYADNFPIWSEHTSAMHQLAVWTMLEDAGFGASLQHYNPLIDKEVRERWDLPAAWRLIAQMPFGAPGGEPQEKSFKPWEERIRIFK